ncbi:MAG: phage tail protein [Chitinophagaceae bacterium]
MAETGKEQSKTTWPLVKFQFSVKIGDIQAVFQEVTGLSAETQQIEFRGGNSKVFSTVKMPGIKKFGNVTLKKGIFKDDKGFWALYDAVKMNTIDRKTITISLLDEKNVVAMSWTLSNAFPSKITATDLKADGNEVSIETMELAHEGLAIEA